jgi:hypothetical protein
MHDETTTAEKLEQQRQLVRQWTDAAPLLEQARQEELLQMTPEERRAASVAVLDLVAHLPNERTTSGLVEQQRIFMRARR